MTGRGGRPSCRNRIFGENAVIKLETLTLTVGIITLSLFACVPPPPPQPAGGLLPISRATAVCPVETFIGKVHFLDTSSSYSLPGSGY
jgi:hypothetical protein